MIDNKEEFIYLTTEDSNPKVSWWKNWLVGRSVTFRIGRFLGQTPLGAGLASSSSYCSSKALTNMGGKILSLLHKRSSLFSLHPWSCQGFVNMALIYLRSASVYPLLFSCFSFPINSTNFLIHEISSSVKPHCSPTCTRIWQMLGGFNSNFISLTFPFPLNTVIVLYPLNGC